MADFPKYISEVSSNHSQDLDRIMKFIDISAKVGCDAVKFQLFKVEQLFAPEVISKDPLVLERKKWELPLDFFPEIKKRCEQNNLQLGCTPFYLEAVDELVEYVDFFKIASYELLWLDLIKKCADQPQPLIISTGMATIKELRAANAVVKQSGKNEVAFLHCESSYPVKADEANLAAIEFMRRELDCKIGWSDHSRNPAVILRAAHAWNAEIFEFHLDLEGDGAEFATGHCWLPDELFNVINMINTGLAADGQDRKFPGKSEKPERKWRADPSDGLRPLKSTRQTIK